MAGESLRGSGWRGKVAEGGLYGPAMPAPSPGRRGPSPLLAALAIAGVALVGTLAWHAWRITQEADRLAAAVPPARTEVAPPPAPTGPPPAPPIPENQIVSLAAPVPAPPLDLPTADGKTVSLAALKGQVVAVNFWATWCPPCAKEMPGMVKLGEALARKHPGKFRMVAVSVDEETPALTKFFSSPVYGGLPKGVIIAREPGIGQVTRAYYCVGRGACRPQEVQLPETYVVDKLGRITAVVVGDIDWSDPSAERYLESLIKG